MRVIETNQWLIDCYGQPELLCEKIKPYFSNVSLQDIYIHLTDHGMYLYPTMYGEEMLKHFLIDNVWAFIKREGSELQVMWDGPDIPVFILPSDPHIAQITKGCSGLAFKDKLFLFIPPKNDLQQLRALLTHEYNHVCRLNKIDKREDTFNLLDTIILEGLAEHAVQELVGAQYIAPWLKNYSSNHLERMWREIVYPNKYIYKQSIRHNEILYGLNEYPHMGGYCVGYHLVQKYLDYHKLSHKDILHLPSETIIDG